MRSLFLFAALAALLPRTAPSDWKEIRARGEKLVAEGSYELAHRAYDEGSTLTLPPEEKRWLLFRLADTEWRSAAATDNPDTTKIEHAKSALDALQRRPTGPRRDETGLRRGVPRRHDGCGESNLAAMLHYRSASISPSGDISARAADGFRSRSAWAGRARRPPAELVGRTDPAGIGADAMKIARSTRTVRRRRSSTPRSSGSAAATRGSSAPRGLDLAISLSSDTRLDDALWMAGQWYENQASRSSRRTATGRSASTT
jgi:hypothetical protein